jgi:1-acyl-sn-glycerol-3-phosphate acyltransferase
MKILLFLRTIISYILIICAGIIILPPCFIIACLPASLRYDNRLFFGLLNIFFAIVIRSSLNKVRYTGWNNLPNSAAIFVSNHQSAFDINTLGRVSRGHPHVWLVLAYYVNAPILGFFITRMFIPVEQKNAEKAALSLIRMYRFIKNSDRHVLIFPEGGRFNDGTIHVFYEGFAVLAKKTGRPVIPVFTPNNGKIYPPKSFYIYNYTVEIIIGEPLTCGEMETEAEFAQRVRQWFVTENKRFL